MMYKSSTKQEVEGGVTTEMAKTWKPHKNPDGPTYTKLDAAVLFCPEEIAPKPPRKMTEDPFPRILRLERPNIRFTPVEEDMVGGILGCSHGKLRKMQMVSGATYFLKRGHAGAAEATIYIWGEFAKVDRLDTMIKQELAYLRASGKAGKGGAGGSPFGGMHCKGKGKGVENGPYGKGGKGAMEGHHGKGGMQDQHAQHGEIYGPWPYA